MDDQSWYITRRWQEYSAEGRVNLLRIASVGVLYCVHLWSYASSQGWLPHLEFLQLATTGEVDRPFHVVVTLLAVAWVMLALGIQLALVQRVFPGWLPLFSTGVDVVLLTSMIALGSGPRSPLVGCYFLILVLASFRFSLPLVRFATMASAAGYLFVLGAAKWAPAVSKLTDEATVPRYHQLIVFASILLAGVMLGQLVRRVRDAAVDYSNRAHQS